MCALEHFWNLSLKSEKQNMPKVFSIKELTEEDYVVLGFSHGAVSCVFEKYHSWNNNSCLSWQYTYFLAERNWSILSIFWLELQDVFGIISRQVRHRVYIDTVDAHTYLGMSHWFPLFLRTLEFCLTRISAISTKKNLFW